MIPDLTEREQHYGRSDLERMEREWRVCRTACPGLEACAQGGWRTVAETEELGGGRLLHFPRRPCPNKQAERQQQYIQELREAAGIPRRFAECTFDNFAVEAGTRPMLEAARRYSESLPAVDGKGLVLVGPVGVGKTHLVVALVKAAVQREVKTSFLAVPELLAEMRAAMRTELGPEAVMERVQDVALLVLDDLGAERVTDWVREQLYRLINHRYERLLPVLATSNLTPDELEAQLGERTISRLLEMCDWALGEGPDRRKSRALAREEV